jgi:hypothetical protein
MQRFLSAVVLASVGVLLPVDAVAQASAPSAAPPAASGAFPLPVAKPSAASPSAAKPGATKPPPSQPAVAKPPATVETTPKDKPADQLSDEAELSRVVGLYEAGKYRECGNEIERLLDPTGRDPLRQPAIVENARVYWAACLLGAGDADASDAPLRAAIHENPQMKPPDGLVFPQPVVEHFLKVRDSLVTEIRAAEQARIKQAQTEARLRQLSLAKDRERLRMLEQLAGQETLIYRNRRSFALVPFGVGQFQNRELGFGYTLLVSEVLAGGLCLTSVAWQSWMAAQADSQRLQNHQVNEAKLRSDLATWGTIKRVSAWSFIGIAVAGVVQAQIDFVPEFRETRTLPRLPSVAPSPAPKPTEVSAVPYFDSTGGGVTLLGRF